MKRDKKMMNLIRYALDRGILSATNGNVSCRAKTEGHLLITPSGMRYDTMKAEDLVEIDPDGNAEKGTPSSEWRLHAAIYRAFPEVNAVCHIHAPYSTAFALKERDLTGDLLEVNVYLGGGVRCAAYAPNGSEELAQNAVNALQGRNACLLAKPGAVALGKSLEKAFSNAEVLENAAKIELCAALLDLHL